MSAIAYMMKHRLHLMGRDEPIPCTYDVISSTVVGVDGANQIDVMVRVPINADIFQTNNIARLVKADGSKLFGFARISSVFPYKMYKEVRIVGVQPYEPLLLTWNGYTLEWHDNRAVWE